MPIEKSSFILDTNLWISFLIKGNLEKVQELLFNDDYILIFSRELLDEFLDVVQRPKFQKYFSPSNIEVALEIIIDFSIFVDVSTEVNVCRDPKDNFLLSLAADSKAKYLVTGDNDLLVLENFNGTKIISVSEFLIQL